jgi:hypothetical protein
MGADIHIFTERYISHVKGDEKWVNIDHWTYNPWYKEGKDDERMLDHISIYDGRDYELFGILANVRYTPDEGPISEPRGLPDDVSNVTKKESDIWGEDGHSHTYFTLRELKDYIEKNPMVNRSGMVSPNESKKLDKGEGTPDSWAGWVNDELGWVYREWEDPTPLKKIVDKLNEKMKEEFWICDDLRHPEKEEHIRIVFWFDS